jgi:hypothetical protein
MWGYNCFVEKGGRIAENALFFFFTSLKNVALDVCALGFYVS